MNQIAVLGTGTMGAGIAQVAASHGCTVFLIDVNVEVAERAKAGIGKQLGRLVEKGRLPTGEMAAILDRLHPLGSIVDDARLKTVDLAIEAIVEDLPAKHRAFQSLERACAPDALLATNTSSLSVSRIAEGVAHRSRVVGMHFFNPAPLMPLVEVIAGKESDARSVERGLETARRWGKTAVRVKDTPGFIVNRVARGYYLEALRLLGEGVAGVHEIDAVMRRLGHFKMGPFELMDLVGLDVNLAVSTSVWEQMGRPARLMPHQIQRDLVAQGHLGRKTGQGFYRYEDDRSVPAHDEARRSYGLSPLLSDVMRAFTYAAAGSETTSGATEQLVFCRILGAVINEAGMALEKGVATAGDIDTAMRLGTNYPKGPLAWAEQIGYRTVRGLLKALNESTTDRRYQASGVYLDGQ